MKPAVCDKVWARPLTKAEMAGVLVAIETAETYQHSWVNAIVAVFDIALRDEGTSWEALDHDIRPWDYAIPSEQWQQIGTWLTTRQKADQPITDIGRINILLDWMNKGPSGYEPSDVLRSAAS